jgi:uncharacterized protein YqgC (DUF456 family)
MTSPILAVVVFSLFYLVAFAGIILPVLPGVPLAAVGVLLAGWIVGFQEVTWAVIGWVVALAVLAQISDYAGNIVGAKYYGASKPGLWGGIFGSLAGLVLLPPFGFLIGAVAGAVAAELLNNRSFPEAVRSGLGAFVGTLGGIVVKLLIMVAIGVIVFPRLF